MNLPVTEPKRRVQSIDILRGIIMVIMALDHTRDLLHIDAMKHNPLDLTTTTPILFFTRWGNTFLCTNICISFRRFSVSGRVKKIEKRADCIFNKARFMAGYS